MSAFLGERQNRVEVLFDGYSSFDADASGANSALKANCTCTLVIGRQEEHDAQFASGVGGCIKMLVDTMTAWDGMRLLEALRHRGISADEITHVVGTHGHSDHIGNLNLFLKAQHIVGTSMNYHETYYDVLQNGASLKICAGIEIIPTPGHTASCVSVVVSGTEKGTIAVVGDLFEKQEDINQPHLWEHLAGSENPVKQARSRQKVLLLADYIVPGHGPMFAVTDEMRKKNEEHLHSILTQYSVF